jgi:hypothetical protein
MSKPISVGKCMIAWKIRLRDALKLPSALAQHRLSEASLSKSSAPTDAAWEDRADS